jgi:hypothetical protein
MKKKKEKRLRCGDCKFLHLEKRQFTFWFECKHEKIQKGEWSIRTCPLRTLQF